MYTPEISNKTELAHDMRQGVAEIGVELLKEITKARLSRNYPLWINLLDSFYTEVAMKFNDKEKEKYKDMWNNMMSSVEKFKGVFEGRSQEETGHSILYQEIREIEIWVKTLADKKGIFGSKRNLEGLS